MNDLDAAAPISPLRQRLIDVTAERGSPAYLDGRHDFELGHAQMTGVPGAERGSMAAKDVRDLQR